MCIAGTPNVEARQSVKARPVVCGLVALGIAAALVGDVTSTAGAATPLPPLGGKRTLFVTMKEWTIRLPNALPAGPVTITVRNQGKLEHELVLLRTDLRSSKLPFDKRADKFNEKSTGIESPGELEHIKAGQTKSKSFDLPAGHYVFVCNIAAHYRQGMRVDVTVK